MTTHSIANLRKLTLTARAENRPEDGATDAPGAGKASVTTIVESFDRRTEMAARAGHDGLCTEVLPQWVSSFQGAGGFETSYRVDNETKAQLKATLQSKFGEAFVIENEKDCVLRSAPGAESWWISWK